MRRTTLSFCHIALLAAALCSESALAAFDDEATPAAPDDGGLLAGPKVDEEPGAPDNPAFSGEDRMRAAVEVPAQRWFQVVDDMELHDEQKAEVSSIRSEFQELSRTYRRENAEVLRDLERRLRESRQTGAFDAKLREEYRALQDKAPKAEPFQERIYKLLDESQQADLRVRLEKVREEIAARRAQERDDLLSAQRSRPVMDDAPMTEDDPMSPSARPEMPPARDGARPGRGQRQQGAGLDAMSSKRLEFLLSKQSRGVRQPADPEQRARPQRPGNRNPRRPANGDEPMGE